MLQGHDPMFMRDSTNNSFGFDPINGIAWNNGKTFRYGQQCESGHTISCIVHFFSDHAAISYARRICSGGEKEDFGVAFELPSRFYKNNLLFPSVMLGVHACMQLSSSEYSLLS